MLHNMKIRLFQPLPLLAILAAFLVALPVFAILSEALQPDHEQVWAHLADTVLPEYAANSLLLAAGAGLGAALLGVGCAWIVAMHHFRGRGVLEWALLLPLAMPTYVIAYVYTDLLQFSGPVQIGRAHV